MSQFKVTLRSSQIALQWTEGIETLIRKRVVNNVEATHSEQQIPIAKRERNVVRPDHLRRNVLPPAGHMIQMVWDFKHISLCLKVPHH